MMRLATADPSSRYRLLAKWASGGMADVYVARHVGPAGFDKIVAIKLLRDQGDSPTFRDMFLEEVRTAALLNHPCIVQTFDAGELGERLYMTMEFVNGETLGRFARAVAKSGGVFPCELAIAIVRDLANALDYAHTLTNLEGTPLQLVHRDVSPSNVLVSFDGMVKLLDFGIAKVATQLSMTGAGIIKGKFSYMSPEQARGDHIDQRSDVYSLGLCLWQLLVGRPAFHADSDAALLRQVVAPRLVAPSQAGATCSEEVDELVMAALAPDPNARYQTAAEFATALGRYMTRRAVGFDATKVIRGLMNALFKERREKLQQLVRNSSRELPLEDIDHLAQQPSMRTPPPPVDTRQSGMVGTLGGTATNTLDVVAGIPVTVNPTTTHLPAARGRWQAVALLAAVVAVAGYITVRETVPAIEPAPPPSVPASAVATRGDVNGAVPHAARAETSVVALPDATQIGAAAPAVAIVAQAPEPAEEVAAPAEPIASAPSKRAAESRRAVRPPPPSRTSPARASTLGTAPTRSAGGAAPSRPAIAATQTTAPATEVPAAIVPPREPPPPAPTPIDAGVAPATSERRAKPVETAGSLDAVPRVMRVSVDGSLPTSEIRTAMERAESAMRACYRTAARKAAKTPALAIKVSFEIDEARAARSVRIAGDTLGVAGCIGDALSGIRTRVAPDVGIVAVTALIKFAPVDD